jgi:hypothetical protein
MPAEFGEPWEQCHYSGPVNFIRIATVTDSSGKQCQIACFGESAEESQSKADRIVACVNACEGIPTDRLERIATSLQYAKMDDDMPSREEFLARELLK